MSIPFAHPWILILLALPIIIGTWEWRRPGLNLLLPFDHAQLDPGDRLRRIVNLANLLPATLMAIAIVLVAGPQRSLPGELVQQSHNVQILVDVSGSMRSRYGSASRFDAAMKAIDRFVHYRRGDAFALSFFGTGVFDWMPLSKDVSGISLASQFLSPELVPRWMNGTMIGAALRHTRERMAPIDGDRMVILVTDGQSDDLGPQVTPQLARSLANDRFVIFSIFIGDPATDSPADLQTLSSLTGGRMFSAEDPKQLAETFKHIDAMVPAKFKRTERTSEDFFLPVICVGLTLLALHLTTSFALRYTPW